MSILDITEFGALGNRQQDDAPAIQAAINNSYPGDVIWFPEGHYRVGKEITLLNDRAYQGQGTQATVLEQFNFTQHQWGARTSLGTRNVILDGFKFVGAGLLVDDRQPAKNLIIRNCEFEHIKAADQAPFVLNSGIWSSGGMQDCTILHNNFRHNHHGTSLSLRRLSNSLVAWNTFYDVEQAISCVFDPGQGPYPGTRFICNRGRGVHRMGVELQGGRTQFLIVQGNRFEDFFDPFEDTFGLSIVVDQGEHTLVAWNEISSCIHSRSRYGYGIELGGKQTICTNNLVHGPWWRCISLGTAPEVVVKDNILIGSEEGVEISWENNKKWEEKEISGNLALVEF